ncbi:MAG TPA: chemotaxis protein CheD [Verrucomicrobiae bacterium]
MPSPSLVGFEHKVVVGIADFAVTNNQNLILSTYSLGSCIGIAIYDPVVRVGGLLHAMLPDSTIDSVKAANQPAMFIDTGIPALFRAAYDLKAEKYRLKIYVAGGAQIMDNSGFFNIGRRNYEAMSAIFAKHGLKPQAEEVGGLVNRTMYLHIATGEVTLKTSGQIKETNLCKS